MERIIALVRGKIESGFVVRISYVLLNDIGEVIPSGRVNSQHLWRKVTFRNSAVRQFEFTGGSDKIGLSRTGETGSLDRVIMPPGKKSTTVGFPKSSADFVHDKPATVTALSAGTDCVPTSERAPCE